MIRIGYMKFRNFRGNFHATSRKGFNFLTEDYCSSSLVDAILKAIFSTIKTPTEIDTPQIQRTNAPAKSDNFNLGVPFVRLELRVAAVHLLILLRFNSCQYAMHPVSRIISILIKNKVIDACAKQLIYCMSYPWSSNLR